MNEPGDLVVVPGEVGRELRADDQIDRPAVALGEVQQPPGGGVREDFFLRIPLEGQRDALDQVAGGPQLLDERAHVHLGAAVDERHLRFADHHACGCSSSRRAVSRGVAEVDDVAVRDDVFLALEPHLAVIAAGRQRPARDQPS